MKLRAPLATTQQLRGCSTGFSLIELMVVVSLIAILASLAAPSFTGLIERYRVESARDNLVSSAQLARIEAIRQGQRVVMRRKTDCPNNDWSCGWISFPDTNNNDVQDAGEATIRETETIRGVEISKNNNADWFAIDRFGQSAGVIFSFRLGPQDKSDSVNCIQVAVSMGFRFNSLTGDTRCP